MILDVAILICNRPGNIVVKHVILDPVVVPHPVLNFQCQVIHCKDVLEALHADVSVGVIIEEELIKDEGVGAVVLALERIQEKDLGGCRDHEEDMDQKLPRETIYNNCQYIKAYYKSSTYRVAP